MSAGDPKVRALSGYGVKGPACFLVETQGARLLLDLGEGPEPGRFPDLAGLGRVDAILISHGHADHTGGLHLAGALGAPPVYATATVRALGGHPALAATRDLPFGGATEICGVAVETGRAGHAPGGVWLRIGGPDGVLYTGDLSRENLLFSCDPPPPARLMIADCSYGDYDRPLSDAFAPLFDAAERGPLVLPAPAGGRGLEMAVLFHENGHAVRLCATHRKVANLLLDPASPALAPAARDRLRAMIEAAHELDPDARPDGVTIAANGLGTAGASARLIERFAADPAVFVVMTGHVEPDTPAGRLRAEGRAGFVRWNVHPRLSDLDWLAGTVAPEAMLPAFLPAAEIPALQRALGRVRFFGPESALS